jgi:hypothetical protein
MVAAAAKIRAATRGRALAAAAARPRADQATSRFVIPGSHAAARAPRPSQGAGQARRSPSYADAPEWARKRRKVGQGYVGKRVYRSAFGRIHEGHIVEYALPVKHQTEKYMGKFEQYTIDWGNGQATSVNWFELEPFLNIPLKWQDDPGRRSVHAGQGMQPVSGSTTPQYKLIKLEMFQISITSSKI